MRFVLMLGVMVIQAGQVFALSCEEPDIADSFLRSGFPEREVIFVRGRAEFPAQTWQLAPRDPETGQIPYKYVPGTIEGFSGDRRGFRHPVSVSVTRSIACADFLGAFGELCKQDQQYSAYLEDEDLIYFLYPDPDGQTYHLSSNPCAQDIYLAARRNERRLRRCIRGGQCERDRR